MLPKFYVSTPLDRHCFACFLYVRVWVCYLHSLIPVDRMLFLSLGVLVDTPSPLWSYINSRSPHSPVAKLAIVFACWHVLLGLWLVAVRVIQTRPGKWWDKKDVWSGVERGRVESSLVVQSKVTRPNAHASWLLGAPISCVYSCGSK